jgi:hypothetical protein
MIPATRNRPACRLPALVPHTGRTIENTNPAVNNPNSNQKNRPVAGRRLVRLSPGSRRHYSGAGGFVWSLIDREQNPAAFGCSRPSGRLHSTNRGNDRLGAAQHDLDRPGLSVRTRPAVCRFGNPSGPFSLVGSLSIWRRPLRLAEIFAFSAPGMSGEVAGDPCLDSTPRRAGGRHRNVFFLPEGVAGRFLAGHRLRLVLSVDGFFCSMAGFSHRSGGLLAAVAFSGR